MTVRKMRMRGQAMRRRRKMAMMAMMAMVTEMVQEKKTAVKILEINRRIICQNAQKPTRRS
jgi:hypothetical protein